MTDSPFEQTATFATIEELKQGDIQMVNQYRLTWDNFLLITHYNDDQTFVLLSSGVRLIINRSLRQVLRDFSAVNHCYRRCSVPYYEMLGERHPIRAYVAGRNLLVPSMGTNNAEVVYYMAKPLKMHCYSHNEQGMLLMFETVDHRINVLVPAYEKKFDKILDQADEISHLHLLEVHEKSHRYGTSRGCGCYGNQYYELSALTKQVWKIKQHVYGYVFNTLHEALYGERLSDQEMKRLLDILFDTWRQ